MEIIWFRPEILTYNIIETYTSCGIPLCLVYVLYYFFVNIQKTLGGKMQFTFIGWQRHYYTTPSLIYRPIMS